MEKITNPTVYDCNIIVLGKSNEEKGNLTVVENYNTVPFDVKRIFYLYDIPGDAARGSHAHRNLYQLMIAAGGSFDVIIDDGNVKRSVTLNRPYYGLLVMPGIWCELVNFSSGSICLVLASEKYDENDYIDDYEKFIQYKIK